MFKNRNYREWSILKRNAPLEVNFSLFVEEMTGRAFWLKAEIGYFLVIYSITAIPMAVGNAVYEYWSFNSVVLLIIITFTMWFCFKLRREIEKLYLTGVPTVSDD